MNGLSHQKLPQQSHTPNPTNNASANGNIHNATLVQHRNVQPATTTKSHTADARNKHVPYTRRQISAILFYAITSFFIVVVNKIVLTTYSFKVECFMTLVHQIVCLLAILLLKQFKRLNISLWQSDIAVAGIPLAFTFALDTVLGMTAIAYVNLSIFTALRRLTTLFNVILQYIVFKQAKSPSVIGCIILMIIGATIARYGDLQFDLFSYSIVLLANLATASRQTLVKWLSNKSHAEQVRLETSKLGKVTSENQKNINSSFQTLYYNSLLSIPILIAMCTYFNEWQLVAEYPHLHSVGFQSSFLLSAFCAFLINYSSNLCTIVTDQTTTSVTGQAKNVFTMIFSAVFMSTTWPTINLTIGLCIGVIGSVLYFYCDELKPNKSQSKQIDRQEVTPLLTVPNLSSGDHHDNIIEHNQQIIASKV